MTNYKVLKSEFVPMAKVKELLADDKKELSVEQKHVVEHVSKNTPLNLKETEALLKDLNALEMHKLKQEFAVKIADVLPKDKDDLKIVLQSSKLSFEEAELDKIMQVVSKYTK